MSETTHHVSLIFSLSWARALAAGLTVGPLARARFLTILTQLSPPCDGIIDQYSLAPMVP